MGRKTSIEIVLTEAERQELQRRARGLSEAHRVVVRAQVILRLAAGTGVSKVAREVRRPRRNVYKWARRFTKQRLSGLNDKQRSGRPARFSPDVTMQLVKLACELPDRHGRSLSLWTCAELARTLRQQGVVDDISPQTVQRLLQSHRLKPWRVHHWLSAKTPRDETFRQAVLQLCDLYTRVLMPHERVLCLDERTSLQPRTRTKQTLPAQPGGVPVRVEHEYQRKGALNLLAAFDTRSGQVIGICRRRKRQREFIELLDLVDRQAPREVTTIHLICDNVRMHHGRQVLAWLERHPRFRMHFTPVHCSWMNQVEQWFSILQRKRLQAPNFDDLHDLEAKIVRFISQWNETAHPFHWTAASFNKVLDTVDDQLAAAA